MFLLLDPAVASQVEAPFLGRRLALARGAFVLARLSRAPIVPIVARWHGTGVAVVRGEAVHPGSDDEATAAAVAGWLEHYLLEHPEQIGPRTLELLS